MWLQFQMQPESQSCEMSGRLHLFFFTFVGAQNSAICFCAPDDCRVNGQYNHYNYIISRPQLPGTERGLPASRGKQILRVSFALNINSGQGFGQR